MAVFKCAATAVAVPLSHRFDNGGKVMRATLSIQMTELVQYKLRFSYHLMIRDRNLSWTKVTDIWFVHSTSYGREI